MSASWSSLTRKSSLFLSKARLPALVKLAYAAYMIGLRPRFVQGRDSADLNLDRVLFLMKQPSLNSLSVWYFYESQTRRPLEEFVKAMEEFLARQRDLYVPQLERYARALRTVRGWKLPLRFGLYYPRIGKLDWWVGD